MRIARTPWLEARLATHFSHLYGKWGHSNDASLHGRVFRQLGARGEPSLLPSSDSSPGRELSLL